MVPVTYVLADSMPFGAFPDASTEYGLEEMAPGDNARYITIQYASTLNQAVTIQAVGGFDNTPRELNLVRDLGGSVTVADGSSTQQIDAISLVRADFPESWYGLTLTTGGTAPTAGVLNVRARIWEEQATTSMSPEIVRLMQELSTGQHQLAAALSEISKVQREVQEIITGIISNPSVYNSRFTRR